MRKTVNILKNSFTFVGTLIGAGFATGREISLYFGDSNIITLLIAAISCALLCFLFSEIGRLNDGKVFNENSGIIPKIINNLIILSNFVILIAMLSGTNLLFVSVLNFKGSSFIILCFALIVIKKGSERMRTLNFLVIPLIIILSVILLLKTEYQFASTSTAVISPILYAGMNIITSGYIMSDISKNCTKSENLMTAFLTFVIIMTLLLLFYVVIQKYKTQPMPILDFAKSINLQYVGLGIILMAIITTLVSSLSVCSGNKFTVALCCGCVALILSILPFNKIVNTAYPLIGGVGLFLSGYAVYKYIVLPK